MIALSWREVNVACRPPEAGWTCTWPSPEVELWLILWMEAFRLAANTTPARPKVRAARVTAERAGRADRGGPPMVARPGRGNPPAERVAPAPPPPPGAF